MLVLVIVRYGPDGVQCGRKREPESCRDRQKQDDWNFVSFSIVINLILHEDTYKMMIKLWSWSYQLECESGNSSGGVATKVGSSKQVGFTERGVSGIAVREKNIKRANHGRI